MRPAECLSGITLKDEWLVGDIVKPGPHATGGHFSVGYNVTNTRNGVIGYLKSLLQKHMQEFEY
jgi:hypothetical protein